ncbi:MAG: hypothetical protein H6553_01930 [Chitinophagales bacterium]|nr:hypothetical protein [Chitinophagales bacterium]
MKKLFVLLFAAVLFVGFSACKGGEEAKEETGEAIDAVTESVVETVDAAVDSTGAAISEAADSVKSKVEDAVH